MNKKAPPVVLKNVTKHYGSFVGIEDISLTLQAGEIFGFLGPNGAGKTTTINMLVNLTKPTSGNIELFGLDNQLYGIESRRRIGYLAGDMSLDKNLTGAQQLEYFGRMRGTYEEAYIKELATRLGCDLTRKIKTLSRGNKQKVALFSALAHKPELLILDEPTSGLDPLVQAEFNEIIQEHKKAGKTAFISSHVLSEVQELCDRVAFIREGKLIANKPLKEIVRGAPKRVRIITKTKQDATKAATLTGLSGVTQQDLVVRGVFGGDAGMLLKELAKLSVADISIEDADLETIFMQYYGEHNA